MFIPVDDLQKLRTGISKLYQDKRVVVAPCRCKLYISKSQKVIDVEGKTSPDWNFFANGVTSLIYNPDSHGLLLTLFDIETSRLLWMLKMNENTIVRAPNSTFHIVNTSQDFDEHVGMIYESRDVANLLLNTYELLSQRRQQLIADAESGTSGVKQRGCEANTDATTTKACSDEILPSSPIAGAKRRRKSKLLRSLSFHGRNRGSGKESEQDRRDRSRTVGPEDFPDPSVLRLARDRRPLSSPNSSEYNWTTDERRQPLCRADTSEITARRLPLSERRADTSICFGKSELTSCPDPLSHLASSRRSQGEPTSADQNNLTAPANPSTGITRGRSFFSKKGKLTRSQSLKVWRKSSDASQFQNASSRPASKSFVSDDATKSEKLKQNQLEREKYAKQRVTKPRACSDSLLLHGSIVKCVVDTGNFARKSRERRSLMKALSNGRGTTTDLCTTEL